MEKNARYSKKVEIGKCDHENIQLPHNPNITQTEIIQSQNQNLNEKNENLFYCKRCGSLSLLTINPENMTKKYLHLLSTPSYYRMNDINTNPFDILNSYYSHHLLEKCNLFTISYKIPKWYNEIRETQIEYLLLISNKYKADQSTFYLAIEYMDEILFKYKEYKGKIHINLITISAFILAKKFNEIDDGSCYYYDEDFYKIVKLHKSEFPVKLFERFEVKCLQKLNYFLNKFTIYDLVYIIKNFGFIFEYELKGLNTSSGISSNNSKANMVNTLNKIYEEIDILLLELVKINSFYFKYNFYQIAFSIFHYIRNKYNLRISAFEEIVTKVYNYSYKNYKDAYFKLKEICPSLGYMHTDINTRINNNMFDSSNKKTPKDKLSNKNLVINTEKKILITDSGFKLNENNNNNSNSNKLNTEENINTHLNIKSISNMISKNSTVHKPPTRKLLSDINVIQEIDLESNNDVQLNNANINGLLSTRSKNNKLVLNIDTNSNTNFNNKEDKILEGVINTNPNTITHRNPKRSLLYSSDNLINQIKGINITNKNINNVNNISNSRMNINNYYTTTNNSKTKKSAQYKSFNLNPTSKANKENKKKTSVELPFIKK